MPTSPLSDREPDQHRQLAGGYRIDLFAEQDIVGAADIVAMWTREGALSGAEAQRRASEILLVATDRRGQPVGVSTTVLRHNDQLRAPLWYIRAFVATAHRQSKIALVLALTARDHLVGRFNRGEDRRGIGLIVEVENEGLRRHFSGALWQQTDFLFIGESDRGAHVRVHFFPGAQAPEPAPASPPQREHDRETRPAEGDGYRITVFDEQDLVSGSDVAEMWTREGVLSTAEAERRVGEILVVAATGRGRPVGVCTAFLGRSERLHAELWHVRVFVAGTHRGADLARSLLLAGRDLLERRYVAGEDRRGIGILAEVENVSVRNNLSQAEWPSTRFLFIGENVRGDHVRVYFFPGAAAPEVFPGAPAPEGDQGSA